MLYFNKSRSPFLKDHVTLKTEVGMLKIQIWSQKYSLRNIQIENRYLKMLIIFHNIAVFIVFLIK